MKKQIYWNFNLKAKIVLKKNNKIKHKENPQKYIKLKVGFAQINFLIFLLVKNVKNQQTSKSNKSTYNL